MIPSWPDDPEDPPGSQPYVGAPGDPGAGSTSWMASGACHDVDPELFFPISGTGRAVPQIDAAKAICGDCIVRETCLSFALQIMPHGIWGGTTRDERIAMRLRLVRSRVPAE